MKTPQLYQSLEKALTKVIEAKDFPDTEPMRESLIQRFEYTFELAWKLMSSILAEENMKTVGVKNIIRSAAQLGLHSDPEAWFAYAEARNLSSHIYKEEIAEKVYLVAKGTFSDDIKKLLASASAYVTT